MLTGESICLPGVEVSLWSLDESEEALLSECRCRGIDVGDALSPRSGARRLERLAERLLVHAAVGDAARLTHDGRGAPLLEPAVPRISISHTRGMVALACRHDGSVGIDVEYVSPRVLRVRERFLATDELRLVPAGDVAANTVAWTAKEAMYKAEGGNPDGSLMKYRLTALDRLDSGGWHVEADGFRLVTVASTNSSGPPPTLPKGGGLVVTVAIPVL